MAETIRQFGRLSAITCGLPQTELGAALLIEFKVNLSPFAKTCDSAKQIPYPTAAVANLSRRCKHDLFLDARNFDAQ
jgi:hypothetical protein